MALNHIISRWNLKQMDLSIWWLINLFIKIRTSTVSTVQIKKKQGKYCKLFLFIVNILYITFCKVHMQTEYICTLFLKRKQKEENTLKLYMSLGGGEVGKGGGALMISRVYYKVLHCFFHDTSQYEFYVFEVPITFTIKSFSV